MENAPPVRCFAPTALMLGNLVTGCSVLAPAGMLSELSEGFAVSISTAGLLITFGAVMLCVASPLSAWLTSRVERRALLAATLAVLALGNLASSLAPDYVSLLAIRIVMLAIGALYTPQAAGTAALIVPAEKRGSPIAYVFLGWSQPRRRSRRPRFRSTHRYSISARPWARQSAACSMHMSYCAALALSRRPSLRWH